MTPPVSRAIAIWEQPKTQPSIEEVTTTVNKLRQECLGNAAELKANQKPFIYQAVAILGILIGTSIATSGLTTLLTPFAPTLLGLGILFIGVGLIAYSVSFIKQQRQSSQLQKNYLSSADQICPELISYAKKNNIELTAQNIHAVHTCFETIQTLSKRS